MSLKTNYPKYCINTTQKFQELNLSIVIRKILRFIDD